jgi:hypothetical protein
MQKQFIIGVTPLHRRIKESLPPPLSPSSPGMLHVVRSDEDDDDDDELV